jgi:hypothetical protein
MLEFEFVFGEFSCHFQNSNSPNIREFEYEFELGEFFPTPDRREGINGNPVLTLDDFSLLERLAKSLVRSIASPFDYARVPSSEGTGPHRGLFYRSRLTVS